MTSHIAIAAAEGGSEQPAKTHGGDTRRVRAAPRSPSGSPDDDLEERLGDKLLFSVRDLATLAGKSEASIFRYLRLGQLSAVTVGGYRHFTRSAVLHFLRFGTRTPEAA